MCIPISNAMHAIVHLRKNLSLSLGKKRSDIKYNMVARNR